MSAPSADPAPGRQSRRDGRSPWPVRPVKELLAAEQKLEQWYAVEAATTKQAWKVGNEWTADTAERAVGVAWIQRLSFGSATCACALAKRWPLLRAVCDEIHSRIGDLSALDPDTLKALPEQDSEERDIAGTLVRFTTYRNPEAPEGTLVVVQAYFRTFRHANYIPLGGAGGLAGRMTAEGILLTPDRRVIRAPDHLLWEFR